MCMIDWLVFNVHRAIFQLYSGRGRNVDVFVFSFLFSKTHVQLYIFSYTIHHEQSLTLLLNCPCLCCHSFFLVVSAWSFWVEANLCMLFLIVCLYLYCTWRFGLLLTALCHGLLVFSCLRWEVVVRFVDIGRIYTHPSLNFLFINKKGHILTWHILW